MDTTSVLQSVEVEPRRTRKSRDEIIIPNRHDQNCVKPMLNQRLMASQNHKRTKQLTQEDKLIAQPLSRIIESRRNHIIVNGCPNHIFVNYIALSPIGRHHSIILFYSRRKFSRCVCVKFLCIFSQSVSLIHIACIR